MSNIFKSLFSFSGKFTKERIKLEASSLSGVDALFSYILKLLNSPEPVKEIFNQYDQARKLPADKREKAIIQAYFTLESFIVTTKPVITKVEYTTETFREEIRNHVNLESLSDYFRLIFLPDLEQAVVLYTLGIRIILNYIFRKLGKKHITSLSTSVTVGTLLENIPLSLDAISQEGMIEKLKNASLPAVVTAFRALYLGAFTEITANLSQKEGVLLFKETYAFIKSIYSYDLVALFMDVLPRDIFETERLSMLSREELEKNVMLRTQELSEAKAQLEEKVQQIETQNKQLEETKLAVLNVLEDEKILEAQLKEERDRATTILSSMGEGLYVVDRQKKIMMINQAAEKLLGVLSEDVLSKEWYKIIELLKNNKSTPVEDRPVSKTLRDKISVDIDIDDDCYYQKPNGEIFPVSLKTAPLISGNQLMGVVVVFRDITTEKEEKNIIEQKVVERTKQLHEKTKALELANEKVQENWLQLQKEKARLTASINNLSLGFIMTDSQENIIMINPAALNILDIDGEIKSLQPIEQKLMPKCDLHAHHLNCHQHQQTIHIKDIVFGKKYLTMFLTPILLITPQREDIGTVIIIQDITEAKIIERSKDEFFSIASHELRTPLTAIRGNASLIKQYYLDKLPDKDVKEMIVDIHESTVRLIEIVNDFLDTSRLEQGKIEFKKEEFNLTALIDEIIEEYKNSGTFKHLYLKFIHSTFPLPYVSADKNRIKQVIINLIGNALKFTSTGGITIETIKQADAVKVLVHDTGRGISLQNQNLLFRKFQQAGDSLITRDTTKGTGLGLYISKLMVEGMGGKIALEKSEVGKGSTFSFTLPIVATDKPEVSPIRQVN